MVLDDKDYHMGNNNNKIINEKEFNTHVTETVIL